MARARRFCSLLILATAWACTRGNPSFGVDGSGDAGGTGSLDTGTPTTSGGPGSEASSNASVDGTTAGPSFCGDGVVDGDETCDDGDRNGADGASCTADCKKDRCGDGHRGPNEGCDDGNDVDDDGCNNLCRLASCGNNQIDPPEQCDDGNDDNTDGCIDTCIEATCGDTFVWVEHEQCDDGNNDNGDECLSSCKLATCGDTFTWIGAETCDDGNDIDTDECTNDCQLPACNDGILSDSEECDGPNTPSCGSLGYGHGNTSCTDGCALLIECCGDGVVSNGNGEACDEPDTTLYGCDHIGLTSNGSVRCNEACLWAPTLPGDCCLPEGATCGSFPLSELDCCGPGTCSDGSCAQG